MSRIINPSDINKRPEVKGKFIFVGDKKFYVRGVTYGTFQPDENGIEYDLQKVDEDFRQIAANGFNSLRTYTVPPRWLLDSAQRFGLYVMVGLPWEQHITFLDDTGRVTSIEERVAEGVRLCAGHSAVLCYAIGNEIPSAIVRWYGARKIENFLKRLYFRAKKEDPEGLVTYVNYPSTEYLQLPFVDFLSFNVYLETDERLSSYLARLQNIAGDLPLVLAEIGLDSHRNGTDKQASALEWQIRTTFHSGAAGAFVFSWTDEWFRGGQEIKDWDFGLTTRDRNAKPALAAVAKSFGDSPFSPDVSYPKVSVVICSYNGGGTIRDCMEGLLELDYPDFEVIVVDDGSVDNTAEIVSEYPFRLIRTENRGLSSARNTGLEAATGDIIAYTDDDAMPDPHWLRYVARTFMETNHAGVGGPNIAPRGDGWIAECVANAPGGPIHVLLDDETAEHIPGCNCSFRTDALRQIGGWDPKFRSAGDDVDVCWRLQHEGMTIGFNPAAMVWHHRRNSIKDYWKQQVGYGRAESLLEEKWPEKYNAAGHLAWNGRLYGKGLTQTLMWSQELVYHGKWGTAPFQSVYQRMPNTFWSFPLMPEWYLIIILFVMLSAFGVFWEPLLLVGALSLLMSVGVVVAQAIMSAAKASFPDRPKTRIKLLRAFGLTAFLHILQPLARLKGRVGHGLTPWRRRGSPGYVLPFPRTRSVWNEGWRSFEEVLATVLTLLEHDGAIVKSGGNFDRWDLEVRGGMMASARLLMTLEEHGAGKQLFRFKIFPRVSLKWSLVLLLLIGITIGTGIDVVSTGGLVIVTFVWSVTILLLLLFLMYRECAAPFASVLGSLDSFERQLNAEVSESNSPVRETEANEVMLASTTVEQRSQIFTRNGSKGGGNRNGSKSPTSLPEGTLAPITKKKATNRA
ncbi:MAG: glycosyltransferase [Pyrinomonadaceae bacterium]